MTIAFLKKLGVWNPMIGNPDNDGLYEQFHGVPSVRNVPVYYDPPKKGEKLIKIGRLVQIDYVPERGQHQGTQFYHKSGDLGHKKIKSNAILCTNQAGTQLYLVREDKNVKFPVFSERGILG